MKNKRILITCGPTWVALDAVRVISNRSSGTLGQMIAQKCKGAGAKVTLLLGPVSVKKKISGVQYKNFTFFDELKRLLRQELKKKYDVVIHAAAVADYKPAKARKNKISSNKKILCLTLVRTRKLIDSIKRVTPDCLLVGFKLEPTLERRSVLRLAQKLFDDTRCDLVVANRSTDNSYQGYILNNTKQIVASAKTREELARQLVRALKESL